MGMNPEVKARWVAALRSGEYEQANGALKNERGFCCLGVLCDLYAKERRLLAWDAEGLGDGDEELGVEVQAWAGLEHSNPSLNKGNRASSAAGMNDTGSTFSEIADAIEAQL